MEDNHERVVCKNVLPFAKRRPNLGEAISASHDAFEPEPGVEAPWSRNHVRVIGPVGDVVRIHLYDAVALNRTVIAVNTAGVAWLDKAHAQALATHLMSLANQL